MTERALQTFICKNEEQTTELARHFVDALTGGVYVSLEGDLGAGKTFFARAVARELGIAENITSPTFVLQKTYNVKNKADIGQLAHYDFYRITNFAELLDLGFEDHDDSTVVLAEWGDLFISEFPGNPVRIKFTTHSDDSRLIVITGLATPLSLQ